MVFKAVLLMGTVHFMILAKSLKWESTGDVMCSFVLFSQAYLMALIFSFLTDPRE
jgi:hypothetical protein